jgi:hypothetical protein
MKPWNELKIALWAGLIGAALVNLRIDPNFISAGHIGGYIGMLIGGFAGAFVIAGLFAHMRNWIVMRRARRGVLATLEEVAFGLANQILVTAALAAIVAVLYALWPCALFGAWCQ